MAINSQPIELQSLGNMRMYQVVSWETRLLKKSGKQKQALEKGEKKKKIQALF